MEDKKFIFKETEIKGLWTVKRRMTKDDRGGFSKFFSAEEFHAVGVNNPLTQINVSYNTLKGTLRGMHFQYPPYSENKIVSCLKGEIFDVAVDLRQGSKTFLSWHAQKLSCRNLISLIIPEGFAHGFQTLVDDCELLYLHTGFYVPESEGGFNAVDKNIGIEWPLPITCMSGRDRSFSRVPDEFKGLQL